MASGGVEWLIGSGFGVALQRAHGEGGHSTSSDLHMLRPPTTRARGNVPARIHAQIDGKVALAMAQTKGKSI
jgi:hypothetical protein